MWGPGLSSHAPSGAVVVMVARSLFALAALAVLCAAMPAQADVFLYLTADGPLAAYLVHERGPPPPCETEDLTCRMTCGTVVHFDPGYSDPDVNLPEKKVVAPGPGPDRQQIVILGHWTVCV